MHDDVIDIIKINIKLNKQGFSFLPILDNINNKCEVFSFKLTSLIVLKNNLYIHPLAVI